jgi:hypothetical protein
LSSKSSWQPGRRLLPRLSSNPPLSHIHTHTQMQTLSHTHVQIKVESKALMEAMCVPKEDFLNISASMYELCFDVVGVEKTKKKAAERKTNSTVLDNHR